MGVLSGQLPTQARPSLGTECPGEASENPQDALGNRHNSAQRRLVFTSLLGPPPLGGPP